MIKRAAIALILGVAAIAALAADEYRREDALEISQAALGRQLGNHLFRDVTGQTFELDRLHGKPAVISMIYTSCHHVCPTITRNLAKAVDIAAEALGEDTFVVLTVGFDWAEDTPDRMRTYAVQQGIDAENWFFLAGDAISVEGLSADLGFLFYPSPKGFDHLTQTTVVDADGVVYRQIYGVDIEAPALVEPLKALVFDTPSEAGLLEHWVDTFLLFCTVYDPNSGRYRFDYSIATTIFVGSLCLAAVASFLIREWRRAS